jgi:hypothetical protein
LVFDLLFDVFIIFGEGLSSSDVNKTFENYYLLFILEPSFVYF